MTRRSLFATLAACFPVLAGQHPRPKAEELCRWFITIPKSCTLDDSLVTLVAEVESRKISRNLMVVDGLYAIATAPDSLTGERLLVLSFPAPISKAEMYKPLFRNVEGHIQDRLFKAADWHNAQWSSYAVDGYC